MKIHRHLVEEILMALDSIFREGLRADKVIERTMKAHRKWGSRDRKFFAENVYEVVRWKRLLEHLSESDDLWMIWGAHWLRKGHEIPQDWPETDGLTLALIRSREQSIPSAAVRESYPDELYAIGAAELGTEWESIAHALNKPADVYLRTNALKITPQEVIAALAKEDVQAVAENPRDLPLALRLKERKNTFVTQAFKSGYFEVQDAASQMVAPLLDIQPGQRVVDACAGAGGKTLHIAALMRNKGKIIAMDIYDWKLTELKLRARRNSVDIIETKLIDSSKVIKRMAETADRLLLDVPCSGMGVIRRNPDAKWKISAEEIARLQVLQQEILSGYSGMVKKGGLMVYATCSILPSENEKQVQKFLAAQGDAWSLVKEIHIRPDREGYDGFYGALLKRV